MKKIPGYLIKSALFAICLILACAISCNAQMIKNLPTSTIVDKNTYLLSQEFQGGTTWSLAQKSPMAQIWRYIKDSVSAGSGTVTSISITTPSVLYTVSPTTITTSGTFAFSLINQLPHSIFGNFTGSTTAPSFFQPTGTPSSSTYLRGDGSWSTPAGTTYTGSNGVALSGTNFSLDYAYAGTFTNATWNGNAIDLSSYVTGNLATSHLNGGTSSSSTTFWRGDGTWATPIGTTYSAGAGLSLIGSTFSITSPISPAIGGTGISNNTANTLSFVGNYPLTLTLSASTSVTLPTSGTLIRRSDLSSTAAGITYNSSTGVFGLTAGYYEPTTTDQTNWNSAYTNRITSLTTTGSSGSATLSSNVLNIPTYTLAGLGGISLTSLSASGAATYNNSTGVIGFNAAYSGTFTNWIWNGATVGATYGGTGISNPTQYAVMIGNGASAMSQASPGSTIGYSLQSQGSSANPSFQDVYQRYTPSYSATLTPSSSDIRDIIYSPGALTGSLTLANPTGTFVDGQIMIMKFYGSSAQSLTFGTSYNAGTTVSLPTTTTAGKELDIEFMYSTTNSINKWLLQGYTDGH